MSDIKSFWEDHHHRDAQQWLTGTSFDQIMKFYSLTQEQLQHKVFLEIGVGLATVTASLSKSVDTLYCADISEHALKRVESYAAGTWLTTEIDKIPSVDIALCHLVLVHCDDAECQRILASINLRPGGKIYCQFSCLTSPDALKNLNSKIKPLLVDSGMHFFRDETKINRIIESAGLKVVTVRDTNPGSYHGWHEQYWKLYQLETAI